eukprot:scaffold4668_cov267-Chaetoceros_neogracile.AAC.5
MNDDAPQKLREALRLIHSLQKERGASASHYSYQISHPVSGSPVTGIGASLTMLSRTSPDGDFFSAAVMQAREHTNVAFQMLDNAAGWVASLKRVRKKIDESCDSTMTNPTSSPSAMEEDATVPSPGRNHMTIGSHRVIVMFNILIGNVIDECIVQEIQHELNSLNRRHENVSIAPKGMNKQMHRTHSRNRSQEFLLEMSPSLEVKKQHTFSAMSRSMPINTKDDATDLQHNTLNDTWCALPPPSECAMSSDWQPSFKSHRSSDEFGVSNGSMKKLETIAFSEYMCGQYATEKYTVPIPRLMPPLVQPSSADEPLPESSPSTPKSTTAPNARQTVNVRQIRYLLSLLLSFTKLKESTGTERAIISSLMALSPDIEDNWDYNRTNAHSTKKLFSDLVVEEANQRRIARELQEQVDARSIEYSLLQMVEKFTTPSPQMRDVQDMIKDFNLKGLQRIMPLEDFWTIITLHIDQLHALELMLIEELRMCCVALYMEEDTNLGCASSRTARPNQRLDKSLLSNIMNSDWNILSESEVAQELATMPAEQVKQLLLRHVQGEETSTESSRSSPKASSEARKRQFPIPLLEPPVSSHNLKEWEIDLYEIEFRQRIGRGVGGTTYLAKWSGREVAVKVSANTDLGLEGWYTEVHSLKHLHHPNVIRLLGAVYNPPQTYGLVLEYCNSGDLSKALERPTPANFFWKIADDVANGMSYLHRKQILHRDIKPGNILLEGDVAGGAFSAKLTDFGVAIMHESLAGEEHTAETGTYRWMSPEVIRHESYSLMADVYSYALVLWQLVTHEIPFQPMSQLEAAGKVALENARPIFPADTPKLIVSLIERCWSQNPDDRLPFGQITIELKEIHKELSEKDKDWLRSPTGHPVYDEEKMKRVKHSHNGGNSRSTPVSSDSQHSQCSSGDRSMGRSKSPNGRRTRNQKSHRKSNNNPKGIFSFFQKKGGNS